MENNNDIAVTLTLEQIIYQQAIELRVKDAQIGVLRNTIASLQPQTPPQVQPAPELHVAPPGAL